MYDQFCYHFDEAMAQRIGDWLTGNSQHRHGVHRCSQEQFGLAREELERHLAPIARIEGRSVGQGLIHGLRIRVAKEVRPPAHSWFLVRTTTSKSSFPRFLNIRSEDKLAYPMSFLSHRFARIGAAREVFASPISHHARPAECPPYKRSAKGRPSSHSASPLLR